MQTARGPQRLRTALQAAIQAGAGRERAPGLAECNRADTLRVVDASLEAQVEKEKDLVFEKLQSYCKLVDGLLRRRQRKRRRKSSANPSAAGGLWWRTTT